MPPRDASAQSDAPVATRLSSPHLYTSRVSAPGAGPARGAVHARGLRVWVSRVHRVRALASPRLSGPLLRSAARLGLSSLLSLVSRLLTVRTLTHVTTLTCRDRFRARPDASVRCSRSSAGPVSARATQTLDARGHASSLRVQPLSGVPLLAHSLCDSTAAVATHTHTHEHEHEHMNMVHTHGTTRTTHAACGRRLVRTGSAPATAHTPCTHLSRPACGSRMPCRMCCHPDSVELIHI